MKRSTPKTGFWGKKIFHTLAWIFPARSNFGISIEHLIMHTKSEWFTHAAA